jgi:Holliday junction resolvasome RuvABC endonuclease subunit
MSIVKVVGIDPSLSNFGLARLHLDLTAFKLKVHDLHLIETEKRASKTVRQNSDDLRRCQEIVREYHKLVLDWEPAAVFAEIPTGAQSARAMYAFGTVVGMLASCPIRPIQVQPFETKLATVGTKTASKEEMIEWAVETYPDAPWLRDERNGKNKGRILNSNEHLADAVAIAHAGIVTDQFQQLIDLMRLKAA